MPVTSRIPTLDIRRFTHPASPEDRQAFVDELGAAYREWGFAGIRNHGIPQAQIDEAYETFKRFFALPEESKKRYHVEGGGGARGYTPFGVETAKGAQYSDLKEFWHIGREIADDSPHRAVMPANPWPQEIPEFKRVGYGLYQSLDALGSQVLSALALHLGLAEDFFADKTDSGNSILRPIHYPPITADDIPNVRAGAHEDINTITLLLGAEEAGLELLTSSSRPGRTTVVPAGLSISLASLAIIFEVATPTEAVSPPVAAVISPSSRPHHSSTACHSRARAFRTRNRSEYSSSSCPSAWDASTARR